MRVWIRNWYQLANLNLGKENSFNKFKQQSAFMYLIQAHIQNQMMFYCRKVDLISHEVVFRSSKHKAHIEVHDLGTFTSCYCSRVPVIMSADPLRKQNACSDFNTSLCSSLIPSALFAARFLWLIQVGTICFIPNKHLFLFSLPACCVWEMLCECEASSGLEVYFRVVCVCVFSDVDQIAMAFLVDDFNLCVFTCVCEHTLVISQLA